MSEWQSIETAPKDGRWFFVWHEKSCLPIIVRYETGQFKSFGDFGMYGMEHGETFSSGVWMPLPEPPK